MSTVEEIVKAIKELSPEKSEEVRRQLLALWQLDSRYAKAAGLPIKRARPRRPPIEIKGKPVSETVIEDPFYAWTRGRYYFFG
jgi:hypothetical protein